MKCVLFVVCEFGVEVLMVMWIVFVEIGWLVVYVVVF